MLNLDLNSYMTDMVYELVPNVKKHGNELIMKCPICGDSSKKKTLKRGHWYINEGMYYCFNGGCAAGDGHGMSGIKFLSLLAHKTIIEIKAELIERATKYSNINNKITNINIAKVKNFNTNSIDNLFDDKTEKNTNLIENTILDNTWTDILPKFVEDYLKKRKINLAPYLPKNFKFYYNKKYNRLIIPWINDYYQERALTKKDEENYGKYIFPPNINKSIFGLNNIDQNFKYIFLLEGVFDSIFVKNGVAVGGLNLSSSQKELLLPYQNNGFKIIFFMDNQWCDKSAYEKTIKILKEQPFTELFIWPNKLKNYKDVNDTIIESNNCIKLWSNENFLISRIFHGLSGTMELFK